MKISEIRQIPAAELSQRIAEEVAKYNQLVLNHSISPLENPSQIKAARRTIAQMKTVLREIELNK
ncbi:MAG: 50S ribosomal protein L29 [Prevotellamassilia sp.]|jgi:large subunit ribosomal protein L29|uniref:50S ribosomal protein L29 n=1 Tax=Prevotellamassilia timonensis TaxID=1852370 RepID=UPI00033BF8BE|nr:50S ribosomal protein L29 [Prevotellamassilia timonensis]MBL6466533.1 50S ribosomal protein L29 [Prevotellamassilia sp.]CDA42078.1 50S ribosomal protein L29 [Prevotella sp. CAG:5226]HBK29954.1 50S ribosomal protein L29 [Parabacteroides sp.]